MGKKVVVFIVKRWIRVGFLLLCLTLLVLLALGCGRGAGRPGTGSAQNATGGSGNDTVYEMKIGNATANDAQDMIANLYAEEITKASGGRIQAKVYNGSQLGDNTQMNQSVQAGTLEALIQPLGFMAPFVPEVSLLDLPFLFKDLEEQNTVLATDVTRGLREKALEKGFVILNFYSLGMRDLFTKFPIESMADLKGKKFRVHSSPELVGQFNAWEASAVPMALVEVYTALQQGTIDGLDNPIDTYFRLKHHEAAPNVTLTKHGALSDSIVVSKLWFDQLPKDLQELLLETGKKILPDAHRIVAEAQVQSTNELRADKNVTIREMPEDELEKLRSAVQPLWEKIRADADKGPILAEFEKEVQKHR